MKISEAFSMYIEEYARLKNQSESTLYHYKKYLNNFVREFGDLELEEVSIDCISQWYKELTKSRCYNTAREYICGMRVVLRYCKLRGFDCLNYELIPTPKRQETVPTFLTSSEVSRMIDCAYGARGKFIISLLYSSGIRLAEMLSLNRGQIVERRFTVIGKGNKPRLCFIDERTEKLMQEYLKDRTDNEPALFINRKRNHLRMTATNVQMIVANAARNAGLADKHVHPHTLRHSFATNFLRNNGNMRYLSTLMGHANLDTTAIYTHVVDADLEEQYHRFHTV